MELLEMGMPFDEYEPEAAEIIKLCRRKISLKDFISRVKEIFQEYFSIDSKYDLSYLDKMAREIYRNVDNK